MYLQRITPERAAEIEKNLRRRAELGTFVAVQGEHDDGSDDALGSVVLLKDERECILIGEDLSPVGDQPSLEDDATRFVTDGP